MRRLAYGLLIVTAAALAACGSAGVTRRELTPLPGVTTPTTLITLPGATIAPATTLSGEGATTPTSASPVTSPSGPRWKFGGFRSVPQLGSEPVRGSGCGADGTIGEVIPDGWWLGIVAGDDVNQLKFDLVCGYYGSSAQPLIDECLASAASATCTTYFDSAFWPVNRNTRTRAAPKLKSFEIEEMADLCGVATETRVGGVSADLDWLLIANGSAVYMRRGCGSE